MTGLCNWLTSLYGIAHTNPTFQSKINSLMMTVIWHILWVHDDEWKGKHSKEDIALSQAANLYYMSQQVVAYRLSGFQRSLIKSLGHSLSSNVWNCLLYASAEALSQRVLASWWGRLDQSVPEVCWGPRPRCGTLTINTHKTWKPPSLQPWSRDKLCYRFRKVCSLDDISSLRAPRNVL